MLLERAQIKQSLPSKVHPKCTTLQHDRLGLRPGIRVMVVGAVAPAPGHFGTLPLNAAMRLRERISGIHEMLKSQRNWKLRFCQPSITWHKSASSRLTNTSGAAASGQANGKEMAAPEAKRTCCRRAQIGSSQT